MKPGGSRKESAEQSIYAFDRGLPQPPVALIANGFATQSVRAAVMAAVQGGIRWIHLRDHAAGAGAFLRHAAALADRVHAVQPSVTFSINTHAQAAHELGMGLHASWRSPRPEAMAAPVPRPLGYSAHHIMEVPPARRRVVDYVTYSPVFPTSSKPGHPGTGVAALRRFCAQSGGPVLALGGITPERARRCCAAGAAGVAVLSGILHATDPARAARAYINACMEALHRRPAPTFSAGAEPS